MGAMDSEWPQRQGDLRRPPDAAAEAELSPGSRQLVRETQLATIGRFTARLAHDLRNPLAVIRNAAYVLKRKLAKGEADQAVEYLDMIERELSSTDRMIGELVSLTRGEPPRREPADLDELLAAARQGLPPGLRVDWRREGPGLTLHVDRDQLTRVFGNLFLNSVQAMGGEGGTISVISVAADDADEIRVCDTGPGIPSELAEKVFEPLFTSRRSGTGLGLTFCRQIVERHGGALTVEPSAPGAVFCIRLPRAPLDRP